MEKTTRWRNKIPTVSAIVNYWKPILEEKLPWKYYAYPNIEMGCFVMKHESWISTHNCFACSDRRSTLHRAHILAHWKGGDENVENIHLLCGRCHKVSEYKHGEEYWDWLEKRSLWDCYTEATIDIIGVDNFLVINDLCKKHIAGDQQYRKKVEELLIPLQNYISCGDIKQSINIIKTMNKINQ